MVTFIRLAFFFVLLLAGCLSSPSPQILDIKKTHLVESIIQKMRETGDIVDHFKYVANGRFDLDAADEMVNESDRNILYEALDEVVFFEGLSNQFVRDNPYKVIAIRSSVWKRNGEKVLVRVFDGSGSFLAELSIKEHEKVQNGLKKSQVFDSFSLGKEIGHDR